MYFYSKFSVFFAELMKREWPQKWQQVYEVIKKSMRSSLTQFLIGEIIFKTLLQEICDTSSGSHLSDLRRKDLREVFLLVFCEE